MKQKAIAALAALCLAACSIIPQGAAAYSEGADVWKDNQLTYDPSSSKEEQPLFDTFLKYDLRIPDFAALTEEQQALCKWVYATEFSSDDDILCTRARRSIMGYDPGARLTLEQCTLFEGICDFAAGLENQPVQDIFPEIDYLPPEDNRLMLHCVPDIRHIGYRPYDEYWLDDDGKDRIEIFDAANYRDGTHTTQPAPYTSAYRYYENDELVFSGILGEEICYDTIVPETVPREEDLHIRITKDGMDFLIYPDDTAAFAGVTEDVLEIVIPETVDGLPVTRIAKHALEGSPVQTVTLPDSIRFIGAYAFAGCSALETVNFPTGLQFIGEDAFRYCTALRKVTLDCPELMIADWAFTYSKIEALTLGTRYAPYLQRCEIGTLQLLDNVREIGIGYLATGFEIPETVTTASGTLTGVGRLNVPESIRIFGAYPPATPTFLGSGIDYPSDIPILNEEWCAVQKNTVLCGMTGSEAETYAKAHGLGFLALDGERLPGDLNADGAVSVADLLLMQRFLTACGQLSVPEHADLNGDGKVNAADYTLLKSMLLQSTRERRRITRAEIYELATRRNSLTWEDFSHYESENIGTDYDDLILPVSDVPGATVELTTFGGVATFTGLQFLMYVRTADDDYLDVRWNTTAADLDALFGDFTPDSPENRAALDKICRTVSEKLESGIFHTNTQLSRFNLDPHLSNESLAAWDAARFERVGFADEHTIIVTQKKGTKITGGYIWQAETDEPYTVYTPGAYTLPAFKKDVEIQWAEGNVCYFTFP